MKHSRLRITFFVVAVGGLPAFVFLDAGRGHSRGLVSTDEIISQSKTKPTSSMPKSRSAKTSDHGALSAAARANEALRTRVIWKFGGKPQYGWYLYEPLIHRLLSTDRDISTERFATAIARWQKKKDMTPTGVLDEETFYTMVAEWQDRRLKDRTPAKADQLLTAPISDFYDPTRAEELLQVERETYAAYKRMIAAALKEKSLGLAHGAKKGELAPAEKYLKIISSFRSREYQEKLRRESPNSGSAGLAVNSPHFTGRALDIYVGGDPVDTKDSNRTIQVQTPVYRWLVRNAERFGFVPYCFEPWHWEYIGR